MIGIMESKVSALEKWASEQRKVIANMKTNMSFVKECM